MARSSSTVTSANSPTPKTNTFGNIFQGIEGLRIEDRGIEKLKTNLRCSIYTITQLPIFLSREHSFRRRAEVLPCLHERIHVALIDQARTGVHERRNRRKAVLRPIGLERCRLVMI